MFSKYLNWIVFAVLPFFILAQGNDEENLFLYYDFNNCPPNSLSIEDKSRINSPGTLSEPAAICNDCGIGGAAFFDGKTYITSGEPTQTKLSFGSFAMSFYMKPQPGNGIYDVISRSNACDRNNMISITFQPNTRILKAVLYETPEDTHEVEARLESSSCWTHVALVRENRFLRLFINGELADESLRDQSTVELKNLNTFQIGGGNCSHLRGIYNPYKGYLDEIRFYDETFFTPTEVRAIYAQFQNINRIVNPTNPSTFVTPGQSLEVEVDSTCIQNISWTPSSTVNFPTRGSVVLSPTEQTTYTVTLQDEFGCSSTDEIQVSVINVDDIDCTDIKAPTAFTPNGDGLNDGFRILSESVISEYLLLEVYDQKGHLLFSSTNREEFWDGTYNGELMTSGTYYYKFKFICGARENVYNGTILLMR